MDNFDPERSAREMRKMNRRIYREKYVYFIHVIIQMNPIMCNRRLIATA